MHVDRSVSPARRCVTPIPPVRGKRPCIGWSSWVAVPLFVALSLPAALPAAEVPPAEGITEPFLDVILSSSVPGLIATRRFQEGEFVEKGEVIIELDKRLEELALDRRKLVMDAAQRDLQDLRTLFQNSKGVSQDEVEKAALDYQLAVVDHAAAMEQLQRRLIRAPFSGVITEFYLDVGEAAKAYEPLLRLVDTQRCYFIANVEALAASSLRLDQSMRLEIDTGTEQVRLTGRIVYLAPVVDPASGLLKVKVLFDNRHTRLRPGLAGRMFFN